MDDIEIYNFFKEFNTNEIIFDGDNWYYSLENMRIPISRTALKDFAISINFSIKEAKSIIKKAKEILKEEDKIE